MPAAGGANLTARAIIDTSLYLVLATADGTGRPWSSPVYFAHDGYAEFLWVSAPEAEHSRNIAARPQVGIVIFDSHAPIGTGQGVYISATAEQAGSDNLTRGIETFSQRSIGHGGAGWTVKDVQADSGLRLYRAVAESYSILAKDGQPDHRIPGAPRLTGAAWTSASHDRSHVLTTRRPGLSAPAHPGHQPHPALRARPEKLKSVHSRHRYLLVTQVQVRIKPGTSTARRPVEPAATRHDTPTLGMPEPSRYSP